MLDDEAQAFESCRRLPQQHLQMKVQEFWAAAEAGEFYKDLEACHSSIARLTLSPQSSCSEESKASTSNMKYDQKPQGRWEGSCLSCILSILASSMCPFFNSLGLMSRDSASHVCFCICKLSSEPFLHCLQANSSFPATSCRGVAAVFALRPLGGR